MLLLSLFVAACRDDHLPSAPLSPSIVTAPLAQHVVHPGERSFALISATVPSFAGYFIEGDALVGLVSQSVDAAPAADALASFRSSSGEPELATKTIVIREARYSFRELSALRDLVFDHIFLRLDGVVSLDLDESANSVDIGITEEAQREQIESVLAEIGVPIEAVRFEAASAIVPDSHVTLLDHSRPVRGGFQAVATDQFGILLKPCSLGFNAQKSGKDLVFTASHCTAEEWDLDGGGINQDDDSGSGEFLGYEDMDPDPYDCLLGDLCRHSDAAAFEYMPGVDFDFGFIARPIGPPATAFETSGSRVIDDAAPRFRIIGAGDIPEGGDVQKVGWRTGWTAGEVLDTCVHTSDGTHTKMCNWIADYFSDGGDSGSPVFTRVVGQDGDVTLRGIHWGRDTIQSEAYFSPWSGLEFDFGALEVALDVVSVSVDAQDTGDPFSWVTATADVQDGVSP